MKHDAVISVFKTFDTDYFVASRDLFIDQCVSGITSVLSGSSHVLLIILIFAHLVGPTANFFLILTFWHTCQCLMPHTWVHQNLNIFRIWCYIEYLIMNCLATVVIWIAHHAHNIVGLQSEIDLIDPC